MSPRESKLEEALRAAMKMRRAMFDINSICTNYFAPRKSVAEFDAVMEKLKKENET